ncbi:Helix-turn-helix transcriptional regulator OS=Streptomyces microflavus OX=1919 GN=HUT09_15835 PE=4 SV=1 [Streptomyces microflavus]
MFLGGGELTTNRKKTTHPHSVSTLCDEGARLYASALSVGRIARAEAGAAPCLLEFALLHPDPDDPTWLRPVPAFAALTQRLHPIEREIQERRRLSIELTKAFEPFMAVSAQTPPITHAITVLEGIGRINASIKLAMAECRSEVSIHPDHRTPEPGPGGHAHHAAWDRRQHAARQADAEHGGAASGRALVERP